MSSADLSVLIHKNDKASKKEVFETYYGKLAAIANRYSKNKVQADELINSTFNSVYTNLLKIRDNKSIDLEKKIETEFIANSVSFIKNIRSEYYVSSTVYAIDSSLKNFDLFENNDFLDFNHVDNDVLIKALQQLVPSQRLIFNLYVIDDYTIPQAALLLESSEETLKSNLEKARFNMQKNIEKIIKGIKV